MAARHMRMRYTDCRTDCCHSTAALTAALTVATRLPHRLLPLDCHADCCTDCHTNCCRGHSCIRLLHCCMPAVVVSHCGRQGLPTQHGTAGLRHVRLVAWNPYCIFKNKDAISSGTIMTASFIYSDYCIKPASDNWCSITRPCFCFERPAQRMYEQSHACAYARTCVDVHLHIMNAV